MEVGVAVFWHTGRLYMYYRVLTGQAVRVRVVLRDADLFAIQFRQ